jgi:hypothetical protein
LGLFVEHLVGTPNSKGLKTLFKSAQPPAKTTQNNPTIHVHSVFTVCACNKQKILKKNGVLGSYGFVRKNGGKEGNGGGRWCDGARWWLRDAAVVMGKGVVVWRWWFWGCLGEEKTEMEGESVQRGGDGEKRE